jgi:hypothetical protein
MTGKHVARGVFVLAMACTHIDRQRLLPRHPQHQFSGHVV